MKRYVLALIASFALAMTAIAMEQAIPKGSETISNYEEVWVYNADACAHEAGDVLIWADGDHDGLDVSTTSTVASALVAGVVPYGKTLAASSWGRMQTHGYHPAITVCTRTTAAYPLITSATAESTSIGAITVSSDTLGAVAVALETLTTSTTVKGFIIK